MPDDLTLYSVVRYVPDPVTGESVNIGVVAITEDGSCGVAKFLSNWTRVARFADQDIAFLRDFARQVRMTMPRQDGMLDGCTFTRDDLESMIVNWHNAIQLSPSRASLLPPDRVAEDEFRRYVRQPRTSEQRPKTQLIRRAKDSLHTQLLVRTQQDALVADLLRTRDEVEGRLASHRFDLSIRNGRPYLAAEAISFSGSDRSALQTEIDATAFAISDVHEQQPDIELAVLATDVPVGRPAFRDRYRYAEHVFQGVGAVTVSESQVADWAVDVASRIGPALL